MTQIDNDYASGGIDKATAKAKAVLDAAYGYNLGVVLFKPTLTHGTQTFRSTQEGALAYFVGNNPIYPGDSGFALKSWTGFESGNAGTFINGNTANTQWPCGANQ